MPTSSSPKTTTSHSAPGRQAIIDLHVRGIIDYANEFYK